LRANWLKPADRLPCQGLLTRVASLDLHPLVPSRGATFVAPRSFRCGSGPSEPALARPTASQTASSAS
jgi:hypothetical protein